MKDEEHNKTLKHRLIAARLTAARMVVKMVDDNRLCPYCEKKYFRECKDKTHKKKISYYRGLLAKDV